MNKRPIAASREAWRKRRIVLERGCRRTIRDGQLFLLPFAIRIATQVVHRLGMIRWGKRNARDLRLTRIEHVFPDLPPAFDGLTILHLSDFHSGTLDGLMHDVARLLDNVEVDVAVLTGDYQTNGNQSAEETAASMAPVLAAFSAREGILAVLGNHDRHPMAEALEGMGVRVLINEHARLTRGDQHIHVTGVDDVHHFYTPAALEALQSGPEGFRIALVHSPELADDAAESGIHLYLTGHTHGGQICLPGERPVFTATKGHREKAAGAWRSGAMRGYTSRGIGVAMLPVRFFCRGEVTLHVLTKKG